MKNDAMKSWIVTASLLLLGTGSAFAQAISVDCDAGGSLGAALATAAPGATIEVAGNCRETVTVTTDGISIIGQGGARLTGNGSEDLLTVLSARNIALSGLTLANGSRGLVVVDGAAVTGTGLVAQGNSLEGFRVEGSVLRLNNSRAASNGDEGVESLSSSLTLNNFTSRLNNAGLRAANSGNVRFFGTNFFRDNRGTGIIVEVGASALGLLAEVIVLDNDADGFDLIGGSAQFIGGTLRSRINAGHGIALAAGASLQLGSVSIPLTTEVITNSNGLDGIFATESSSLRFSGFADVQSRGNSSGVHVRQGSSARLSGLEATNNRSWGVVADDGSISLFSSRLEDNGNNLPDLFLRFGSRATVGSTNIGALDCEPSALIRGENAQGQPIACP